MSSVDVKRWLATLMLSVLVVVNIRPMVSQAYVNAGAVLTARAARVPECPPGLSLSVTSQETGNLARTYFDHAIAWQKDNPRAYRFLAGLEMHQGNEWQALVYLKRVLSVNPDDVLAANWVGYLEHGGGNGREARAIWKRYHSGPFLVALGDCFNKRAKARAAEQYYKLALEIDGYTPVYLRLGELYEERGQINEALHAYTAFLNRVQNRGGLVNGHLALGKLHARQGNYARAQEHFEAAFQIKPGGGMAADLGVFLRKVGDLEGSSRWFREWARMEPDNPDPYRMLGVNALDMGQPREAIRYLQEALRKGGRGVSIYFYLGIGYKRIGELQQAREMFEYVLKIEPQHTGARNRLHVLELKEKEQRQNY